MSHAQSLLFPLCLIFSAHSTSTVTPAPSLFFSHGDDDCDDPNYVAIFGPLTEPQKPTGDQPNDLTEMNNTEFTPMFFFRASMTSTYDSAESIATPLTWIGFGWWALTGYAGFTTLLTGERGKCWPITSLWLQLRKVSVKFVSLPNRCTGTCSSVLPQKKVESRVHIPTEKEYSWHIGNILGTSSSLRRKLSFIQTLWIGKFCETSPWRTKRSSSRRGKIESIETRMQSRLSWLFYSWTSKTNSFQSYADWSYQSWIWNISKRAGQIHEELAQRGRAHRETHLVFTRWKNLKELRKCELTSSPGKNVEKVRLLLQELTSQIQELQDRMNLMNGSGEFRDVESICSGKLSNVPSQTATVPYWAATKACDLIHGTCLVHREPFFDSPLAPIDSTSTPCRGMLHSWNLNATDGSRCETVQGEL